MPRHRHRAFAPLIASAFVFLVVQAPALAAPVHIVALGDSATSGWLVRRDEAYPAQLQRMLRAKGNDVAVKNAGVPGDTTASALKRLDLAVDPDTDIVVVELGTNDLRTHVPRTKMDANIGEIVRTLQKRRIGVLLIALAVRRATPRTAARTAVQPVVGHDREATCRAAGRPIRRVGARCDRWDW